MDNLPVELDNRQVETPPANPYAPLLNEARSVLRRLLHNSATDKIKKEVATEILDRGGETKKLEHKMMPQIIIKDSQVQLLVKAAQEALDD